MCILCIRIAANNHPTNATLDALRTHEGDVVCIEEDGHQFSAAERNNGQYRFITVAGVSAARFSALLAPRTDANGVMIKRRDKGFDITVLRNATWSGRTTATATQIDAITVTRA